MLSFMSGFWSGRMESLRWNCRECRALVISDCQGCFKIMLTPGHFPFHVSVVVDTSDGVVVVAVMLSQERESRQGIASPMEQ